MLSCNYMIIDIDCSNAARGLLIGFIVGLSLAVLCFGPETVGVRLLQPLNPTHRAPAPLQPRPAAAQLEPLEPPAAIATPSRPPELAGPAPAELKAVAACVGGALSLVVPGLGRSVRLGVLEPLGWPDVFVAGTLNATEKEVTDTARWQARTRHALDGISELGPFAATSVVRQLTRGDIVAEMRRSPAWAQYEVQIGRGGDGRLRPEDEDPRLWLPTMLSPALGNPSGNVLREMVYQSRCYHMVEAHERSAARRGERYARVLFTRLEFEWVVPHPLLASLPAQYTWIPAGEDNFGLYDRHWLASRRDAAAMFTRWDALLDGSAVRAVHGSARARATYISSEMYLLRTALYGGVRLGRFPMIAYLQCCEEGYRDARGRKIQSEHNGVLSTGDGVSVGAKTCFQAHCNKKRCPSATPVRAEAKDARDHLCRFKYDDEGSAALINAELLAQPGARLELAAEPPTRLEIVIPRDDGGGGDSRFYFCMRCLAERSLTPTTNASAGCLFPAHGYASAQLKDAAGRHACRYFAPEPMRRVCDSLTRDGDKPDHRGKTYAEQYFPWWCKADWDKELAHAPH